MSTAIDFIHKEFTNNNIYDSMQVLNENVCLRTEFFCNLLKIENSWARAVYQIGVQYFGQG